MLSQSLPRTILSHIMRFGRQTTGLRVSKVYSQPPRPNTLSPFVLSDLDAIYGYPTLLPIAIVSLTFRFNHIHTILKRALTSRLNNATTSASANNNVRRNESSRESSCNRPRKWRSARAGLRNRQLARVERVRWVGAGVKRLCGWSAEKGD